MPFDYRVGANRICSGAPLPVYIEWEPYSPTPSPEHFPLFARLQRLEAKGPSGSSVEEHLQIRRHTGARVEFRTKDLVPGAYELSLSIPEVEHLVAPDPIWILSETDFLKIIRDEAEEQFLASPPLKTADSLEALVRNTIFERLRVPTSASEPLPIISTEDLTRGGNFDPPISSSRIQWTTEGLIDVINYVAIGGANTANLRIRIARDTLELHFLGHLREPLSAQMIEAMRGSQCMELFSLNAKDDIKNFSADLKAKPFDPIFEINIKQAIEAHPVLKLGPAVPNLIDRPAGRSAGAKNH
jgi:hypothetical protein